VVQEYGDSTKLIDLGKYHVPVLEIHNYNTPDDYTALRLSMTKRELCNLKH